MKNQIERVKLIFDFLQGSIWISDVETCEPLTGIDSSSKKNIYVLLSTLLTDASFNVKIKIKKRLSSLRVRSPFLYY